MRWFVALLLLVGPFASQSALAADPETTHPWVFIQASECEPEAQLRRRIELRLEHGRGQRRYWLSVWSTPAGGRVYAQVIAAQGETFAWKRELSGETCAEVSDAAAVIVAVDHAQGVRARGASPSSTAPLPERDERLATPDITEPSHLSASPRIAPKLLLATSTGLATRPGLGALVGIEWQPTFGSVELGRVGLSAGYWFPLSTSTSNGRVQLEGWTADVAWQPLAWPLFRSVALIAGATFSLTRVRAEGVGLAKVEQAIAWRSALGPRVSLVARFGRVEVTLAAGAEYNLVPQRFFVLSEGRRQKVHELPRFAPTAAFALSYPQ